jgi:D-lyxose ketol-isomerase
MNEKSMRAYRSRAMELLENARIVITPAEKDRMELADLGLNDFETVGLQIVIYENNDRYCAKELILLPWQICPEHRHPALGPDNPGKQETFRCRWGEVYLYVEGEATPSPRARVPEKYKPYMRVWHEIILRPGDQYTLVPNALHWFQAGAQGTIISEFSSTSVDEADAYTDPAVKRVG